MDGIDTVLVEFTHHQAHLIASDCFPWSKSTQAKLQQLFHPNKNEIERLGEADGLVAIAFAEAVQSLLKQTQISSSEVIAIGSHGQTIRHQPDFNPAFSLQIGDPNRIACLTNIPTIADFRRKDIALGGQGAPLVPAFHRWLFHQKERDQAVLNIGGIANLTLLPKDKTQVRGFDTGPGNRLLDDWIKYSLNHPYDKKGAWAKTGKSNSALLQHMLTDPYFSQNIPKSTGFEYFNLAWLQAKLAQVKPLKPADIQATLTHLTAKTIAQDLQTYLPNLSRLLICGGGWHNQYLITQLQAELPQVQLQSTNQAGLDSDMLEAVAFAWLARQHIEQKPANIPAVTGASREAILGLYCPP